MDSNTHYDFIVVGSGAAGCVCAEKLSQNGKFTVALIEAGSIEDVPLVFDHVNWFRCAYTPEHGWGLLTTPQSFSNDRIFAPEVGKLLGGCSSHNAMMWVRGNHEDYRSWEEKGCTGFGTDQMLHAFRSMERIINSTSLSDRIDMNYHGAEGNIKIQQTAGNEYVKSIREAASAHLRWIDDSNGATQLGMSPVWLNVDENYKRHSSYRAFIYPFLNRSNLTLISGAEATRILFDGIRAVGIEYVDKQGETHQIRARKEVILSCGSFLTPKLLMLSGVGPEDHLKALNIDVVANLPVGKNLQDHAFVALYYRAKKELPPCNSWVSANCFWRSDGKVDDNLVPDYQILFASQPIAGLPLAPEISNQVYSFILTFFFILLFLGELRKTNHRSWSLPCSPSLYW